MHRTVPRRRRQRPATERCIDSLPPTVPHARASCAAPEALRANGSTEGACQVVRAAMAARGRDLLRALEEGSVEAIDGILEAGDVDLTIRTEGQQQTALIVAGKKKLEQVFYTVLGG